MIRKKIVALAVLSVLALGITSEAYDIKKIADERWPSMFTYTEIEGGHTISDHEGKLSYQLGQISLQPPGTKNMICGYLVTGVIRVSALSLLSSLVSVATCALSCA